MKTISLSLFLILVCGGCSLNQGDFGAKFCAVYNSYDSSAFHLQRYINDHKNAASYYWMFLGISEMFRGNILQMHHAFEKAEKTEIFPELLIIRCNWHIESGNIDNSSTDIAALKALLRNKNFSKNFTYYRYLIIRKKIFALPYNDSLWRQVRDNGKYHQILCDAANILDKKLTLLKNTPGDGLLALRRFTDPALSKVTLGMAESALYKLLGTPYKTVVSSGSQRRILIYTKGNSLIGFLFTEKSNLLGEVKVASRCKIHNVDQMRLLKRGRTAFGELVKPFYDKDFYYTIEYKTPDDFNWACLKCKRPITLRQP